MNTLVVYCHPYEKSFNHAVLESVKAKLDRKQENYEIVDLYQDNFSPVYSKEELKLYHSGQTTDPLVKKYLRMIKATSTIIFVTPIWWNSVPGMLKGFIDKVMKEGTGLSHIVTKTGIHGELTNVKHCYVLTTSSSPTLYFKMLMGNGIKKIFIDKTLKQLGFHDRHWQNFGGITNSSLSRRQKYLEKVKQEEFK